ncbi:MULTISPECIES: GGDEF domain-containing protein [Pseudoalteromonas]|uniref:GGDEF domain-containing protein n=1 Tax=Pseudoalteromonas obscura TaxID=3048491 RepID=A0ABT7ET62_9GAMM|nr:MULTISPECIES: GGDEF domain-containing protein [Pseudoalteromonas]MBQ4839674.1 GGDEF domain-containing protein [Pseudoalteromonas luteoviolacea]MDK2598246.1 GGDEF domain-containing protein [Pseudoalteromonas sp. P94(2023)]
MTFHDPMAIAQEKMTKVCHFLELHSLPPTPLNYQVAYTFISRSNEPLTSRLERDLRNSTTIDTVYIEQLYFEFIYTEHQEELAVLKEVDNVIDELSTSSARAQHNISQFTQNIRKYTSELDTQDIAKSKQVLGEFANQTERFLEQQQRFKNGLQKARASQNQQYIALNRIRKQRLIDPHTGLYKRHYLNQKTQLWLDQDKTLCAISIQVDNLSDFTARFGDMIGETVLQRVANKIKKYVLESGVPGRTGKQEFTILLADIEPETAKVIAAKIRKGVEKLKFISNKGNVQFPEVQLAIGIAKRQAERDFNELAGQASYAAQKAHALGRDCYISGAI